MSKMAAYNAGMYRDREGATGPQTRVPIAAFLEQNGFVPSRPGRSSGATIAGPSNANRGLSAPVSPGVGIKTYESPEPMLASIEGDPMAMAEAEGEMGVDKNRMRSLEVRLNQLEGMVYSIQNTSLVGIVEQVSQLEGAVKELENKVGSGCDAEVAKMREVMGGLKSALDKVGGFV